MSGKLWISEVWINQDKQAQYGTERPYESFTDDRGALFRSLREEYGRCIGKVYIDTTQGDTYAIGWVFLKRSTYTDSKDTYMQETWVSVYEAPLEGPLTYARIAGGPR